MRLLIIGTGSIAIVKLRDLCKQLKDHQIDVVLTKAACALIKSEYTDETHLCDLDHVKVYRDEDELIDQYRVGDDVLHVNLARTNDMCLICPLSANSLAKIANGLCDNLATNVVRCWKYSKPLILAPAMNTVMWNHHLTARQLSSMETHPMVKIVPPQVKVLACGECGDGGLANIPDIIDMVNACSKLNSENYS